MAGNNDGITQLLKAEEEASKIVEDARTARLKKLNKADEEAAKQIATFREEMESKFREDVGTTDDKGSQFAEEVRKETEVAVAGMGESYKKTKQTAVDLLVHHATTVHLEMSQASKQAFAKYLEDV